MRKNSASRLLAPLAAAVLVAACTTLPTPAEPKDEGINFMSFSREDRARVLGVHHLNRIETDEERVFESVRTFRDFRRVLGERMLANYPMDESLTILKEVYARRAAPYTYPADQLFHINLLAGRYPVDEMNYSEETGLLRVQVSPVGFRLETPEFPASAFDLTGNEAQEIVSRIDYVLSPHYAYVAAWAPKLFAEIEMSPSEWEDLNTLALLSGEKIMIEHNGGRIYFRLGRCQDYEAPEGWRGRILGCWLDTQDHELRALKLSLPTLAHEGAPQHPDDWVLRLREPSFDAFDPKQPRLKNRTDVPSISTF